jgi:hypothetical protein
MSTQLIAEKAVIFVAAVLDEGKGLGDLSAYMSIKEQAAWEALLGEVAAAELKVALAGARP